MNRTKWAGTHVAKLDENVPDHAGLLDGHRVHRKPKKELAKLMTTTDNARGRHLGRSQGHLLRQKEKPREEQTTERVTKEDATDQIPDLEPLEARRTR